MNYEKQCSSVNLSTDQSTKLFLGENTNRTSYPCLKKASLLEEWYNSHTAQRFYLVLNLVHPGVIKQKIYLTDLKEF